jgi:tetratricopeptide (TPR) repeat protein
MEQHGDQLPDLEQLEEAARIYAEECGRAPGNFDAHFNRGVCLARLGHWQEAAASFRRAADLSPEKVAVWLALGVSLLNADRAREAREAFAVCRQLDPENPAAAFGLAVASHLEGDLDQAARLYDALLEFQPEAEEVYSNAIGLAVLRKDWEAAAELSARLVRLRPDSPAALFGLAVSAFSKGDHQRAASLCARLAEANPENFSAWFNLGVCYRRLGMSAQAVMAFERARTLRPDSPEAFDGLVAALETQGERETVLRLLRDNARREPQSAAKWFRLGCALYEARQFAESALAFENCLNLDGSYKDAAFNLGLTYRQLGNLRAARASLEQALRRAPDDEDVIRALAAVAVESGDAKEAAQWLSRLKHGSWDVAYNLGLLHQRAGQYAAAADSFRRALEENPDCVEALVNLGHALHELGEEQQARHCWQRAIEQRPSLASSCRPGAV